MFPERINRIESMFRSEVARILTEYQQTISATLGGALLTVTRLEISRNLERATIYYSWFNLPESIPPSEVEAVLKKMQHELIGELRERVVLRRFPRISFQYDESFAKAGHVYEILKSIENEETDQ